MSPACEKPISTLENSISLINLNSSCDSTYSDLLDTSSSSYSRSYRNFRSNEEYLWAMKEDLAEWLNNLYEININADNFIEKLETGVILCRHANNVIKKALSIGHKFNEFKDSGGNGNGNGNDAGKGGGISGDSNNNLVIYKGDELRYRSNAKPKTFQARDNVSNFISWCKSLKIHDCLLFETDDLVLGKNEKSFILCLLEVTRKCTAFGMVAPLIVQMEQEIDRELNEEQFISNGHLTSSSSGQPGECGEKEDEEDDDESSLVTISTSPDSGYMGSLVTTTTTTTSDKDNQSIESNQSSTINTTNNSSNNDINSSPSTIKSESQIVTNNLKCLHERVVDLLNRCTCPSQFPMVKVADGKYRVGNPKVLIYVRILRNHVMVRVGGGWDTLGHYLDRHDPCRCRIGTINKLPTSPNGLISNPIVNKDKETHLINQNQVNHQSKYQNHHHHQTNVKSSLLNRKSINGSQIWINYNRQQPYPSSEPQYTSYDNLRFSSGSMISIYPNLIRRDSIGLTESSCSLNSFSEGSDRQPSRSSQYSDDSSASSSSSSTTHSHTSKISSSTITSSTGSSPRSSISSSTGGLNHLSTGQLTFSSSSSSSSLNFNHHNHLNHRHHHNLLIKSHQRDQTNATTTTTNNKTNCKLISATNHKLLPSSPSSSLFNNNNKNHSNKIRSGIAKYIGLTNHHQINYQSRPITNLNKVNSCTNIRFCHQTSPTATSTSPSTATFKHRKF